MAASGRVTPIPGRASCAALLGPHQVLDLHRNFLLGTGRRLRPLVLREQRLPLSPRDGGSAGVLHPLSEDQAEDGDEEREEDDHEGHHGLGDPVLEVGVGLVAVLLRLDRHDSEQGQRDGRGQAQSQAEKEGTVAEEGAGGVGAQQQHRDAQDGGAHPAAEHPEGAKLACRSRYRSGPHCLPGAGQGRLTCVGAIWVLDSAKGQCWALLT